MILQAILQLTLLGLNADDSMNLFTKQQQLGWCNVNGVLIISVGFVFFYNMVAIIAIEYPSGIVSSNSHVWNTDDQHQYNRRVILVRLFQVGEYV